MVRRHRRDGRGGEPAERHLCRLLGRADEGGARRRTEEGGGGGVRFFSHARVSFGGGQASGRPRSYQRARLSQAV